MFPFDFGFIPSTVGGDGDPLDIMVLMVRIAGVIEATQAEDGETETARSAAGSGHPFLPAPGCLVD